MVRGGDEQVLDVVTVFEIHTTDTHAASMLQTVSGHGHTLHIAGLGHTNDHLFHRYHVFDVDLALGRRDLGTARVVVHGFDLEQLLPDDLVHFGVAGQHRLQVCYAFHEIAMLFLQLVPFQGRELPQAQINYGLRLFLGQVEARHQVGSGRLSVFAGANDADNLVQVGDGHQQPLKDMGPLARLVQLIAGAADYNFLLMGDVVAKYVFECQRLRDAVHQCDVDDPESGLHGRVLVELIENHPGNGFALQLNHDAHAGAIGLIAKIGDLTDLLLANQFGDLLDHLRLVDLVRDLRDYDRGLALLDGLSVDFGPHQHAAAAGLVRLTDALSPDDDAPGREVRPLQEAHERRSVQGGILNEGHRGVDGLAQVVRGYVGGHAHGDPRAPIDQQVGEAGG